MPYLRFDDLSKTRHWAHSIHQMREAPFTKEKRVYLSSPDPDLVVELHRVEFRKGLFSSADPDLLSILWKSPKLRTGEIREVPESILQLVAELAKSDTPRAAADA